MQGILSLNKPNSNAECALSCEGEHRALVGRVRLYGKYVVVFDLDTPIEEPVKQLMLLLKAFN